MKLNTLNSFPNKKMSKTLMEVDLMKHATPVKRKRATKAKKVEFTDPEPVTALEPKEKKPRTEKQIAATEKMKKVREEKKAAEVAESEKIALLESEKKKQLEEKKVALAEKRKLARDEKKKEQVQTPVISSVPPSEKPKKEKKEKALVIENVIKQVSKPEPQPIEKNQNVEESTKRPMSNRDKKSFDTWMKKGQSIFGYSYVNGKSRMM
jgi:hypothetical protein